MMKVLVSVLLLGPKWIRSLDPLRAQVLYSTTVVYTVEASTPSKKSSPNGPWTREIGRKQSQSIVPGPQMSKCRTSRVWQSCGPRLEPGQGQLRPCDRPMTLVMSKPVRQSDDRVFKFQSTISRIA